MKKFLASILTFVLLIAILHSSSHFFVDKSGSAKYGNYLTDPEKYDVVFLGSSHTVMGILPMEIWEEYQISTYNLGNYGQTIPVDFWVLKEVFSMHKPKLVVIDTFSVMSDNKYSENHISYLHEIFDNFKFSKLKNEAVHDLFPPEIQNDFLYPFSIYHSQWDNIQQELFIDANESYIYGEGSDESGFYGTDTDILVIPQENLSVNSQSVNHTETTAKKYLRKIIELCQENGVEILLTLTPYAATEEQISWNNSAYAIAEEYGINFFDGNNKNIINLQTDMWNAGHLNSSGARKWSSVLGKYIVENYDIPQYNKGEVFDYWTSLYNDTYMTYKISRITEQDNLYNYLMLAADKNMSICLYIPENSNIYNDPESIALIKNLSQYSELPLLDYAISNKNQAYFSIIDNGLGDVRESINNESIKTLKSSFGCVNLYNKELSVIYDDNNSWKNTFENDSDISIILINGKTSTIEDCAFFSLNETTLFLSDHTP